MNRLDEINHILNEYGVNKLSESLTKEQLSALKAEANTINESVELQYSQHVDNINMLIKEGVEILEEIRKSKMKSKQEKLTELQHMYENYVAEHGENDKAKQLAIMLKSAEQEVLSEKYNSMMMTALNESAQEAEAIMASKSIRDDIIGFQSKIGDIQNKYLDGLLSKITDAYGSDMADKVREEMNTSLQTLMDQVRATKDDLSNIVDRLSGKGGDEDSMLDDAPDESMDDFEDDSEDDADMDFGDDEDAVEGDSEASEDDDLGDLDFETSSDADYESDDFERKE